MPGQAVNWHLQDEKCTSQKNSTGYNKGYRRRIKNNDNAEINISYYPENKDNGELKGIMI